MRTEVIIPWRAGCPFRAHNLGYVLRHHQAVGRHVTLAELPAAAPWRKGAAVARAAERSHADVIVVADADVIVGTHPLKAAIAALAEHGWAVPHRDVHRLTPMATAELISGGPRNLDLAEPAYRGVKGGGVVVLHRATYLDCPIDPRFEGWGGEDESWGDALTETHGRPWRGTAPLVHLWHPAQPRTTRARGSNESHALRSRYACARNRPLNMRALVEEAKTWHPK